MTVEAAVICLIIYVQHVCAHIDLIAVGHYHLLPITPLQSHRHHHECIAAGHQDPQYSTGEAGISTRIANR